MSYPAVNSRMYHSLQLYDGLEIVFDLHSIVIKELDTIMDLIPNMLLINTTEKYIKLTGYKINDSIFMVNKHGDTINVSYICSNDTIMKGVEYLYQIYKNIIIKCEDKQDNKWNPKPYNPE